MDILKQVVALDTPSLSDAMDSLGVPCCLQNIHHRSGRGTVAGFARTVRYRALTMEERSKYLGAPNYIDKLQPNDFVVIDNAGRTDCTSWGDILTRKAQSKGISGVAIHGSLRDLEFISSVGFSAYSTGVTMVSGKNRVTLDAFDQPVTIGDVLVRPGDLVAADACGAIVIPRKLMNEVVERAQRVDKTEREIVASIGRGVSLEESRQKFGYSHPWDGGDHAIC